MNRPKSIASSTCRSQELGIIITVAKLSSPNISKAIEKKFVISASLEEVLNVMTSLRPSLDCEPRYLLCQIPTGMQTLCAMHCSA